MLYYITNRTVADSKLLSIPVTKLNAMRMLRNTVFTAICLFILWGIHSQPKESNGVRLLYDRFSLLEEGESKERIDSFRHEVETLPARMPSLTPKDRALLLVMQGGLLELAFQPNDALPLMLLATDSCTKAFGRQAPETLDAQSRLAWAYGYTNHLDLERKICFEQLDFYNKNQPRYLDKIVDIYNELAMTYGLTTLDKDNYTGDRFTEQKLLRKAIELLDNYPGENPAADERRQKNYWNLYNSLAISSYATRNFNNSLDYARKCLVFQERLQPGATLAINLMTIGRSLFQTEHNVDSSLYYLDSSLVVLEKYGYKHWPPWYTYNNYKAEILLEADKPEGAIQITQQIRTLVKPRKEASSMDTNTFIHTSAALSQAYIKSGDIKNAVSVCEATKDILHNRQIISTLSNVALYSQYAHALARDHQWKKSLAEFADAVAKTGYSMDSLRNPACKLRITIPYEYLQIYWQAGDMLVNKGRSTGNREEVVQGLQVMQKTVNAFHRKKQFFFEAGIDEEAGEAELVMTEAFLNDVYACKELIGETERMNMALTAIDVSKAGLLKNKLFEDKLLSSLINKTENLQMLELKAKIFQAMNRVRATISLANEDSLVRARNAYTLYMQHLREKYNIAEKNPSLATDSTYAALNNYRGTVISYFLGADDLYIHTLNNGHQELFKRKIPSGFKADFDYIRNNGLTRKGMSKLTDQPAQRIAAIGKEWYRWLLEGLPLSENLVIIPHRELSFVSFDMLDKAPGTGKPVYVLQNHSVRYEMAASFIHNPSAGAGKDETVFGGFASSQFNFKDLNTTGNLYDAVEADRGVIEPLEKSNEEVNRIAGMVTGRPFLNAHPQDFLENAGKYQVLHVSTHAFADQGPYHESYLLFESDSISKGIVRDVQLMQLDLHAKMVVLSACNTGIGKLNGGEAVNSLGRSFFLSGCPAVVMSLWPANEASTQEILHAFYTHLKEGQGKALALRNAKLDYLKSNANNSVKRYPYYWAGFVVVGDDVPLHFTPAGGGNSRLMWIVCIVAAVAAIAVFALRKTYLRKRASSSVA